MDVRKKLVELLLGWGGMSNCAEDIADYLLENGVTVQGRISVKDKLPQENEPEGATCEQVQVLLSNGVVSTGWCNRHTKLWWHLNYGEAHFIGYDYEHTPVIAWKPLAQPPKGE
jgi:hypothetical protein